MVFLISHALLGQENNNYSDELLSSSFKVYQEVDFEFSYAMFPFIKKRFLEHLKDTSSFSNPYDSLSKYVGIKNAEDRLLKTYSWNERNAGCCHPTVIYAQFKTKSGDIKFIDLKDTDNGDEAVFITDLKRIEVNKKPYYLVLGWGTCCGGTHYSTAKIYEIRNDALYKSKSIFNGETDLKIGANRGQYIELKYLPEQKVLSYNSYKRDDNGFYDTEKKVVKWKLKNEGFKRIN